jgi:hypothetical protein
MLQYPNPRQYPDPQSVVDDPGDKFLRAFVTAVDTARADLTAFEQFTPEWFVNPTLPQLDLSEVTGEHGERTADQP